MEKIHTIQLATGVLQLTVRAGRVPLHRLLGFAARFSSQRKFSLVSKILGKHYPVSPLMMRWSYRALARLVLRSSDFADFNSSLWVGMAELATGLGYGVFAAAYQEGVKNPLFLQTTRYHLHGNERLEFIEAHSHATDFFLYYPNDAAHRQLFLTADALVLIDDEISTGKTFLRLIKAYQAVNPQLRKVFIVSVVNFAQASDRAHLENEVGIAVQWLYLREGVLAFTDHYNPAVDNMRVNVSSNHACKNHLLAWRGRLGLNAPINLHGDVLAQLSAYGVTDASDSRPILVLGTGECTVPAYLLGDELERRGLPVKIQSTSRSPVYQGNDIKSVCQFTDNYEDGIANFIYNLNPADYRQIILCHETPLNAPLLERLHDWQAISARFEMLTNPANYAKLHFFRP